MHREYLCALAVAAACAACATTSADFRLADIGSGEAAIAGRLTINYNGKIFTENCLVTVGHRTLKLSPGGIVMFRVSKGWTSFERLDCKDTSNQHIRLKGAHFFAQGDGWVTDFGDMLVTWEAAGGFKPGTMFGLIGAIVDESSDDGVATVAVGAPVPEVRAAFRQQTGVEGRWATHPLSQPARVSGVPPAGAPPMPLPTPAPSTPPPAAAPPAPTDPQQVADHEAPSVALSQATDLVPLPSVGFFCTSSTADAKDSVCEREQAHCEHARQVQGGAFNACTHVETAWCFTEGNLLRCAQTEASCAQANAKYRGTGDLCGEQY